MSLLKQAIASILPVDNEAAWAADARLNSLTKPAGSLGHLEELVRRYAAIRHDESVKSGRGAIAVFVADHGVADEGVSAFPQAVTVEMLRNIAAGGAAITVLARDASVSLKVVDVGVKVDTSAKPLGGVTYRRIGAGTSNFLDGPAMTPDETTRALEVGIEIARELSDSGATLIGIGEMGIANSTPAAALLCALTGIQPESIVGRGTGLDDAGVRRKIEVVTRALEIHHDTLASGESMLAALGGFEIAAMAGVCIGAASLKVPVVVDGFIATAAAAVAEKIHPGLFDHLFFSHRSAEGGHALALEHFKLRPILGLDMRLGEGTGAALAMNLIESALDLLNNMATFESAEVSGKSPMSDDANAPPSEGGFLAELPLAISFLTILPVIDRRPASEETVAASFAWFPIVGLLIGVALVGEDWLLAFFFAQVIRSVLIVISLTVITGAVHLDGLADTADAFGAGRDRERALDILRDSRVGTFGASAIFFDLTLKILALSTLAGHRRYAALIFAPMLARWAMLIVASGLPYLRAAGSGSTLLSGKISGVRRAVVAVFTLVVMLILAELRPIIVSIAAAIAIVFAMRSFYRRWLGGVTGDLIGACGELVEIAVLVTMAS